MASVAALIVVVVATGQSRDPSTSALVDAARATTGARVMVEESDAPSDDAALAIASRDHAEMVAVVTWDASSARAVIHLHRATDARWLDRAVSFQSTDQPPERGRTLGFAIASMLPEIAPAEPPTTPGAPTVPAASTTAVAPLAPLADKPDVPRGPDKPWHGAVDASGAGALAVGGAGDGVGASLAGHWYFVPRLSLRVGAGVRSGQVGTAQATSLTLLGSIGLGFRLLETRPGQPISLGGRAALLAVRESLSHLSADDSAASTQDRWLPGGELMLEACAHFVPNAAVLLAVGPQAELGQTAVYVRGKQVATLTPWRLAGEVGLRARF